MPTAFFVSGDEENRTLDLLHAMPCAYLEISPERLLLMIRRDCDGLVRTQSGSVSGSEVNDSTCKDMQISIALLTIH